ncbi:MAG TPA: PQQ-binding-like beta-propeller repeat protein [Oligoflexus sp.]|uniref:outer membrane protein assembly factor BamB family protein n=1 Tax=Oligoflexus sp. TaxID=1971216 RepID=UPI002D320AEC|nr:PQQ-binding-like beta-propeller repeat protein [Oligoflexus sp.]HYX34208.1 PQQ-binding-like beta-propeller repeat protein [Oligoflexus sp.]
MIKISHTLRWTLLTLCCSGFSSPLAAQGHWPFWGYDVSNSKNPASETSISPETVKNLQKEWTFETRSSVYVFPTIQDQWLYVTDYPLFSLESVIDPKEDGGWLYALDRHTGQKLWEKSIYQYSGSKANIVSRSSPAIFEDMIIIGDAVNARTIAQGFKDARASMYGINRFTGELLWKTVVEEHPAAQITQSPVVHDGVIYVGVSSIELAIPGALGPLYSCCNFRGSMLALDARTGRILWKTYTVPDNFGRKDLFSGGSIWGSSPSIDSQRGLVYVATGNNYDAPSELKNCLKDSDGDPARDEACYQQHEPADNYFDSVLALDMKTGAVRWVQKVLRYDAWNFACLGKVIPFNPITLECPKPSGGDFDFGQAPMLIKNVQYKDKTGDLVVAGQKTGLFWAFDPDRGGEKVWVTRVGPEGLLGGHEFGSATDGQRIYAQITNFEHKEILLTAGPYQGQTTKNGLWAALDVATGRLVWQMPVPGNDPLAAAMGPLSVTNGVVFAGSLDGFMYGLDAATGQILWSHKTHGSINSAPSIVDGALYWGSGYPIGTADNKLYKFSYSTGCVGSAGCAGSEGD